MKKGYMTYSCDVYEGILYYTSIACDIVNVPAEFRRHQSMVGVGNAIATSAKNSTTQIKLIYHLIVRDPREWIDSTMYFYVILYDKISFSYHLEGHNLCIGAIDNQICTKFSNIPIDILGISIKQDVNFIFQYNKSIKCSEQVICVTKIIEFL